MTIPVNPSPFPVLPSVREGVVSNPADHAAPESHGVIDACIKKLLETDHAYHERVGYEMHCSVYAFVSALRQLKSDTPR